MKLSPPRLLGRYRDRLSIRYRFVAVLVLSGALLVLGAYPLLATSYDNHVTNRAEARADEIARLLEVTGIDNDGPGDILEQLTSAPDVRSMAVADVASGTIVASSADAEPQQEPLEQPDAVANLELWLAGSKDIAIHAESIEIRSFNPGATSEYTVAIEFDRSEIASGLPLQIPAIVGLLFGLVVVLALITYFAVQQWVARPLSRIVDHTRGDPSFSQRRGSANEVSRVRDELLRISKLLDAAGPASPSSSRLLSAAVPDMSILLDESLDILGAHLNDGQETMLDITDLGELLSQEIVDHLVATAPMLRQGESDGFEFMLGSSVYQAILSADSGGFVLQISEGELEAQRYENASVAAAAILAELLSTLPVSLIETDSHGVVQYANRPMFNARNADELIGRPIGEILPLEYAEDGRRAMREARRSDTPQTFDVPSAGDLGEQGWRSYVVAISSSDGDSYLILSTELQQSDVVEIPATVDTSAAEEQLWALELKVSDYEQQIARLQTDVVDAASRAEQSEGSSESLIDGMARPMNEVLRAIRSLIASELPRHARGEVDSLRTAVITLTEVLDSQLDTSFSQRAMAAEPAKAERFHLATLLDEVAIEASVTNPNVSSRISAFVQPSLPKWLYGNGQDARVAALQMIEYARLVCPERPLILAAMQDTSVGRSIQVRIEVQIPPPMLDDDELDMLRGCIDRGTDQLEFNENGQRAAWFDDTSLDIELVTVNNEATVLRCSTDFAIAEDLEAEHAWVRGLRTLIIQESGQSSNGIQQSLSAFGIIGYVVSTEKDLIDALRVAEEHSNPYRLVVADVDTPTLESFVGQLFTRDAPVILVGEKSESAMVGAISAGYSGYIAKPVRQVDLLEVILSTIEPPQSGTRATAA